MARRKRPARPGPPHRHPRHDRRRRPGTAEGGAHRAGRDRARRARRLPRPRRRRPPADPLRARQPRLQVQAHHPGERGYRRAPARSRVPRPGTSPARTGRHAAGKRRTAARPATPAARPPRGCQPRRGRGAAGITVTIWHNVAFDDQGRHTAMLDGYQPGDPVVRVFAYQASPGRAAEEIAEEAFAIFNDHPRDAAGAELACAYYGRRLRSLSFPGLSPCCSRSCCLQCRAMWPRSSSSTPPASGRLADVSSGRLSDCDRGGRAGW